MSAPVLLKAIMSGTFVLYPFLPEAAIGQQRSRSITKPLLERALVEFAISAAQFDRLIGQEASVLMKNGQRIEEATIQSFVHGRDKEFFRTVSLQRRKGTTSRRYAGGMLEHLEVDGTLYRVVKIPSKRAFGLIDETARDQAIDERLARQRGHRWPTISVERQAICVEELKQFLEQVSSHFERLQMHLHETNYFLFLTDMPPAQVAPYLNNLDEMNEKLGQAFGFQPGTNVWYGKAAVVAFVNRKYFLEFEEEFMKNTVDGDYQGVCHQNGLGRVVVGCYRGDDPAYFAILLVHETSHGYVHRYKSTARVPSWLNEGIADWIAGVTVPSSSAVKRKQRNSAERLRQIGTFDGRFFDSQRIPIDFYGSASACVDLLIKQSPLSFRVLVDGIKEGHTWQESLHRSYGLTPEDLARMYGHTIGVPNLTP